MADGLPTWGIRGRRGGSKPSSSNGNGGSRPNLRSSSLHHRPGSEATPKSGTSASASGALGQRVSANDIQLVQNLIERCLQVWLLHPLRGGVTPR